MTSERSLELVKNSRGATLRFKTDQENLLKRAREEMGCNQCEAPLNKETTCLGLPYRTEPQGPTKVEFICPYRWFQHSQAKCLSEIGSSK